jgi:hypothetical protein
VVLAAHRLAYMIQLVYEDKDLVSDAKSEAHWNILWMVIFVIGVIVACKYVCTKREY